MPKVEQTEDGIHYVRHMHGPKAGQFYAYWICPCTNKQIPNPAVTLPTKEEAIAHVREAKKDYLELVDLLDRLDQRKRELNLQMLEGTEQSMALPNPVLLGRGIFEWSRSERITDRYGTVSLFSLLDNDTEKPLKVISGKGHIAARVIKSVKSDHVGDVFRGLFQKELPLVNVWYRLAALPGEVFYENIDDDTNVKIGIKPADGRDADWMQPEILYQLHESIVELYFEEIP